MKSKQQQLHRTPHEKCHNTIPALEGFNLKPQFLLRASRKHRYYSSSSRRLWSVLGRETDPREFTGAGHLPRSMITLSTGH